MEFLNVLQTIINSFGAVVVVPVIIFFIALVMKVKPQKAFMSALLAGVALEGIQLVVGSFTPIISPLVQNMAEVMAGITGNSLEVFDVGWQAASLAAYSTTAGMVYLALGIIVQVLFFAIRWTNVFQPSDLWNNYSYPLWGSMVVLVTGNFALGIALMILLNMYSLLWADMLAKRWSTYYHYPNCTIPAMHNLETGIWAMVLDPIWNLLRLNKVQWSPEAIQKKIGFLGEPMTIGLFLGLFIGILGTVGAPEGANLASIPGWGNVALCAVATSAVMAVFPKITGFFAQAFGPITDAGRKMMGDTSSREWYVSVNDAVAYGESATLTSGLIMMPIVILLAFIIPGNKVLPVVDLVAIPYSLECVVAIHNGNMAKVLPTSIIYYAVGLIAASMTAPLFTEAAAQAGFAIPEGVTMITAIAILARPLPALITGAFLTMNPLFIGLTVVIYAVWYVAWRKFQKPIVSYFENMASKNVGTQAVAEIA